MLNGVPGGNVLGPDGRVRREVRAAAERGVVLDVGHASIHCDVTIARRAIGEGLRPTTLSTDLHTPPAGRIVYNLRGVMSQFLGLGMSLEEVVASVTAREAFPHQRRATPTKKRLMSGSALISSPTMGISRPGSSTSV